MNDLEKFASNYPFDVELAEIEVAKASALPDTKDLKTLLANNTHSYSLDVLK
jgi:hypothetical protein